MFCDVLNKIWPFLENVCLYVCLQNFVDTISRNNARKLMKIYIQLHLDIIWCWLGFSAYRSRSSDAVRNWWFHLHNGIGQNCVQLYLIWIILGQSYSNSKHLFISAIVRSYTGESRVGWDGTQVETVRYFDIWLLAVWYRSSHTA